MNIKVNRQQANRLASLASQHGSVNITYQLEGLELVVSYGRVVTRALIYTTGKCEVTDTKEVVEARTRGAVRRCTW